MSQSESSPKIVESNILLDNKTVIDPKPSLNEQYMGDESENSGTIDCDFTDRESLSFCLRDNLQLHLENEMLYYVWWDIARQKFKALWAHFTPSLTAADFTEYMEWRLSAIYDPAQRQWDYIWGWEPAFRFFDENGDLGHCSDQDPEDDGGLAV